MILFQIGRAIFAISNIWLIYSFLTAKRPLWFQIIAFVGTGAIHFFFLRGLLTEMGLDPFLIGYMLSVLYLVPVALVFKETIHTKFFVVFMVISLSQFNFLFFLFLEQLLFGHIIGSLMLIGQLLELLSIPLIRRYITPHIKNILEIVNHQNRIFTLFPFLSFLLLAFYGIQRKYLLSVFIPLVLSTIIIFCSYYLIAIAIKLTKRHKQLELTARTDSLTGLYNRRYMEQKIQEEYEGYQRNGLAFALIIVDIDFFKGINDQYGHAGGDCLLKSLAKDLKKTVRDDDTVARWGGDEFLLMLPGTNEENAVKVAEQIRETVEKCRYVYEKEVLSVTLTLGVSVIEHDSDTVDGIIKKADLLMYQGKGVGRNRTIFANNIKNKEIIRIL
jgi:diguanylate cyclase (GGDEF)-like protein